jgi:hypothetical protein
MIQGAQLLNSFVILLVSNQSERPLTTTQISEVISKGSKGRIYKNPATLKDALEMRLKREGYVNGINPANKMLYSITSKGALLNQELAGVLKPKYHNSYGKECQGK